MNHSELIIPCHLDENIPIMIVCKIYDVSISQLLSKSRLENIVMPRQILMMYFHKVQRLTQEECGHILNKDHSTIAYACKIVKNMVQTNNNYKLKLRLFCQECNILLRSSK